jgi:hypothetical protein
MPCDQGHAAVVATVHGADGGAECSLGLNQAARWWVTPPGSKAGCKLVEASLARSGPHHPGRRDTH